MLLLVDDGFKCLLALGQPNVSLLCDGELDTLASGQGHIGLVTLSNDKYVALTGGEGVTVGVLNVDNVEGTRMLLLGYDDSNSAGVTTTSDHAQVSIIEGNDIHDFASGQIQLDGIVDLDDGIGVPDGPTVSGVQMGYHSLASLFGSNFAELVLGLGGGDPVDSESTLDVVDDSEVLASLLDLDNVHESSGVLMVGSDPTINLDVTVLKDVLYLLQSHGVPQTVP